MKKLMRTAAYLTLASLTLLAVPVGVSGQDWPQFRGPSGMGVSGDRNLPLTWGAQPHKGLIYFNDINSGLWIVKLGEKIE